VPRESVLRCSERQRERALARSKVFGGETLARPRAFDATASIADEPVLLTCRTRVALFRLMLWRYSKRSLIFRRLLAQRLQPLDEGLREPPFRTREISGVSCTNPELVILVRDNAP
jgi:hypothetical protein